MSSVKKIIDSELCLGCGLCESIVGSHKCSMNINESGFYYPVFKEKLTANEENQILKVCPAIHVENIEKKKHTGVWGSVLQVSEAWSTDDVIRKYSSSGGVISALCIYLLEQKLVDGILQVGVNINSYLYNELKISTTKEDVISNAASRYAPALVFSRFKAVLDESEKTYAFVGKPCDIAGLKNFLALHPTYGERIKYCFAIFCAGMPSYIGTKEVLKLAVTKEEPYSVRYRGDGWPGFFEAKYRKSPPFKMSYNDSWGKILGRHLGVRCKICPDGIGLLADVAVGDSWNTQDGYPDFSESDGKSFVLLRTLQGKKLFNKAAKDHYIKSQSLDINKISEMQQYQYNRRLLVGYRILPMLLIYPNLLKFRGLGLFSLMVRANKIVGIKQMLGTVKRLLKKKKK